jgi:hypothetical protein
MALLRLKNNLWVETDHIVKITRKAKNRTTGGELESYTLEMDNNSTFVLDGADGDFVLAQMGTVTNGPKVT